MGVDVVFKVKPRVQYDEEAFEAARRALIERYPDPQAEKYGQYPDLTWDPYDPDAPVMEVRSLDRYYGVGYERGHWPEIKGMGDFIATLFGEKGEVRYGGDTCDEWSALAPWPEERARLDAHYEAVGNEPYRSRFR